MNLFHPFIKKFLDCLKAFANQRQKKFDNEPALMLQVVILFCKHVKNFRSHKNKFGLLSYVFNVF